MAYRRFAMAAAFVAASLAGGTAALADVTVRMLHVEQNPDVIAYWNDIARRYEAANAGVKVEVQYLENEAYKKKLTTLLQSSDKPNPVASRSTSRSSGQACASRWCASSTGWACCRWVRPGIAAPGWAAAWATGRRRRPAPRRRPPERARAGTSAPAWRSGRCASGRPAAGRRARGRPVRSARAPAPRARPRRPARAEAPDATSASSTSRAAASPPVPRRRAGRRLSTRACAREPSMSCRASRQSKWVTADSAASASAGAPANRPPHSAPALVPRLLSAAISHPVSIAAFSSADLLVAGDRGVGGDPVGAAGRSSPNSVPCSTRTWPWSSGCPA